MLANLSAVAAHCSPGDVLVLFFSGHGTSIADTDGDEADAKDEAWCFTDGDGNLGPLLLDDELAVAVTSSVSARSVSTPSSPWEDHPDTELPPP